jgi:hypothetical protein
MADRLKDVRMHKKPHLQRPDDPLS